MSRMLSLRLIHAMHALTSFSTPLVLAATANTHCLSEHAYP